MAQQATTRTVQAEPRESARTVPLSDAPGLWHVILFSTLADDSKVELHHATGNRRNKTQTLTSFFRLPIVSLPSAIAYWPPSCSSSRRLTLESVARPRLDLDIGSLQNLVFTSYRNSLAFSHLV